jgi:hypothetical protein
MTDDQMLICGRRECCEELSRELKKKNDVAEMREPIKENSYLKYYIVGINRLCVRKLGYYWSVVKAGVL